MQDGLIADTLRLGTDLVAEIQSEPDFPPHYLTNISAKMDQVRAALRLADAKASKLRERSEYATSKATFYAEFDDLGRKVQGLESWLASIDACGDDGGGKSPYSSAAAAVGGAGDCGFDAAAAPAGAAAGEARALEQLEQCTKRKALLTSFGHVIGEMKTLAGEVTLHPGAAEDPANTIKADVYQFCDRWEAVEREFARKESALIEKTSKRHDDNDDDGGGSGGDHRGRSWNRCSSDVMLSAPLYVRDAGSMVAEIARLKDRLERRAGSTEKAVEARIESLEGELSRLHHFEEEVEGISRWMLEVDAFLVAEDPAVGDHATLEAQLKESNALQDDIATLNPNVETINETGQQLLSKCAPTENFRREQAYLRKNCLIDQQMVG